MTKLRTSEILNLIAAIEDSILLKRERQNGETRVQFPKFKELPPLNNPQGELLQLVDFFSTLSKQRELIMNSADEVMENGENEPEE